MNFVRNADKTLTITLNEVENATIEWLIVQRKVNVFKEHIETFLEQRSKQRLYEPVSEIHGLLPALTEDEKSQVLPDLVAVKAKIEELIASRAK